MGTRGMQFKFTIITHSCFISIPAFPINTTLDSNHSNSNLHQQKIERMVAAASDSAKRRYIHRKYILISVQDVILLLLLCSYELSCSI